MRHKRLREDPLVHIEMLNVAVDRRHDRRALTDDEVTRLLNATSGSGFVLGMSASDRHMLYCLALSTGLRAAELASLKITSFSLDSDPPSVRVSAGYSKRRRVDVLPLPTEILSTVREWLKGKRITEAVWPGTWAKSRCAGKMLQVDLKAAGVEYRNAEGLFADFHALRHTYISNLARHGVPLATAQKLARHSTPVLTASRYTHIELGDQHREVQKLPRLLGRDLGQTSVTPCPQKPSDGRGQNEPPAKEETEKPRKNRGSRVKSSGEAGIRTLGRVTPSPVFKTDGISDGTTVVDCGCGENRGVDGAQNGTRSCHCLATGDADLHRLIRLWYDLPITVRQEISTLASTGASSREGQ